MTTTDTRLKGRTRWSLTARCSRMAGYALIGEEPAPENEDTQLLFERGLMDEQWFCDRVLDPRFGPENVIRQKTVPWPNNGLPVGELHTDAFVISEGMPWEIKSRASGDPADFDFVQLAGQIHFDPDATKGAGVLAVIDRNLQREYIPVVLTDDLIEQVESLAADVVHTARTGELAERVCQKPADGRARMCPFVDKCFEGWQRPDPLNLDGDVAVLALDVMHAQTRKRDLTKQAEEAEKEYKELAARLAEWELAPGATYTGSGVKVKRTAFPASEKFSLSTARKAGVWTEDDEQRFAPFVKASGAHDRWAIEQTAPAAATVEDFDEDAPWDDDDLAARPEDLL